MRANADFGFDKQGRGRYPKGTKEPRNCGSVRGKWIHPSHSNVMNFSIAASALAMAGAMSSCSSPATRFSHVATNGPVEVTLDLAFTPAPPDAWKDPLPTDKYFAHPGATLVAKWKSGGSCSAPLSRNFHHSPRIPNIPSPPFFRVWFRKPRRDILGVRSQNRARRCLLAQKRVARRTPNHHSGPLYRKSSNIHRYQRPNG